MLATDVIGSDDALVEVVDAVCSSACVGLDTEFVRERTYRARLCLVQLAVPEAIFVVDPLKEIDLKPLAAVIEDRGVEVIVHAGKQDFELFFDAFGVVPKNVFDVQLAAGFAGYGASLAYGALVKSTLGVSVTGGESYTDWCRRPLDGAQLRYAAEDVRWLLEVAQYLKKELRELGRLEWAQEEMRSLESSSAYHVDPAEAWRRVTGRGSLSLRQLAALRELARWREEEAARRNLPRGWIMKDQTLVEIARRQPQSLTDLTAIRGINRKEAERSMGAILRALEAGKESPLPEEPAALPRPVLARAKMVGGLADALVRAHCEQARIAPELVCTRAELELLLGQIFSIPPEEGSRLEETISRHRLLRGWRRALAGEAVLGLARGRVAVRLTDSPPYLEEIEL